MGRIGRMGEKGILEDWNDGIMGREADRSQETGEKQKLGRMKKSNHEIFLSLICPLHSSRAPR
jgi:hypothetical protein